MGGDDGNEKWDDMILSQPYSLPLYIIISPTWEWHVFLYIGIYPHRIYFIELHSHLSSVILGS